jgi:hypothetical protein
MGVGKRVKYVHADDAAEFEITDIDLTRVYSDLKDMTLDAQDSFERFL